MKRRVMRGLLGLVIGAAWLAAAAAQQAAPPQPPRSADDAVAAAREAARAERHAEAIEAFGHAIAAAPGRRGEWLLEWADQHTWSRRLEEAIALYREAITSAAPGDTRRARIGLARALSWADRQADARDVYAAVLHEHPDDEEAQRGLARVQSWLGRHRDAATRMQAFLQRRPRDREATVILAESLAWMGRPDRAAQVLRRHLAADPQDLRAAALLGRIERPLKAQASVDWRDVNQSDKLDIRELQLAAQFPLAGGRGSIGPRYVQASYKPASGAVREIQVRRPGLEARWRISDALEWHGNVFVETIDTRGAAGDHRRTTHDSYLTWWPSDLLRLDLGSSRWTFDSEEALRKGLTARQLKLSMDVLPDARTGLSARASRAEYSDGNRRAWWQLQAERRVWEQPRVALGYRYTAFDFTMPGQGGYYNPERYHLHEALLQASGELGAGVSWELRWALGREDEGTGGSKAVRAGGIRLAWEARPGLQLEVAYDHSTSRTEPTGGFARGIARLTLRYRP